MLKRALRDLPGPPWLYKVIRLLILLGILIAIFKGMEWFLEWHFEQPIKPRPR